MVYSEFGNKLHDLSEHDKTDVEIALFLIKYHYNIGNVTYHLSQTVVRELPVDSPFVRTTYPPIWVSRYLLRSYIEVDPIVREGMFRALPFGWNEVSLRPEATEMMQEFASLGFSVNGYSIPLIDKAGRRALISFNARSDQDDWNEIVSAYRVEWAEIAHIIHNMAIAVLPGAEHKPPTLGKRELEVLSWTARGKDYLEIAIIMGISEHTVRSYMRSARAKLDSVNLTQAVTIATKLRLIRP
ncbi:LuxR family transcriptional regulator [Agrobacterium vitis]|uniref:LuxR family transcriptional regulator n=1 Tax=Agrobacterium vitis TaxID=373 RepID=A0A7K1RN80_AGRVI|nr:LuxR family transcriptional regulator [Agrobacterium vitis]MVA59421.1 LuxR family transcriptional regulator [Agrobacterium vitis]